MTSTDQISSCISTRLHRLTRTVDEVYRKHLNEVGVSESQMSILLTVHQETEILQSVLGQSLRLERSTVSRNLARMVKEGWLKRSEDNGRKIVSMTRKGKQLVKDMLPAWNAAMHICTEMLGSSGTAAIGVLERRLLEQ